MAGIDGTYNDSCIVCLKGTRYGTRLPEPEWAIAGLTAMGVPEDEATSVVRAILEEIVKTGEVSGAPFRFRVCELCAAPFPVALAIPGQPLPAIVPPA